MSFDQFNLSSLNKNINFGVTLFGNILFYSVIVSRYKYLP